MSLGWILPVVLSLVGTASAVALFPVLSNALQKHRPEGKGAQMISLGLEQIDPIFNQNRMHLTKQREHEAIMPAAQGGRRAAADQDRSRPGAGGRSASGQGHRDAHHLD